jgi:hypothetical protein
MRTLEQFRQDEARVLTEALAKAMWDVYRDYAAEDGLLNLPAWDLASDQQKSGYLHTARKVLLAGCAIHRDAITERITGGTGQKRA